MLCNPPQESPPLGGLLFIEFLLTPIPTSCYPFRTRSKGYNLKAKHVIHTVGPVWRGLTAGAGAAQGADELLANCYRNSLRLAVQHGVKTIAFPAISTGVYRFPPARACGIAVRTVTEFLKQDKTIEKVHFVCFDAATYDLYVHELAKKA